jgi:hypothetical protein
MPGMIVENTTELINPNALYQGRVALTGAGATTVDLGATYRNIELWLDRPSTEIHVRINPDGTTTAADTDDPMLTDEDHLLDQFQTGISVLYVYDTGVGTLNVRAW